ncbi:hypothetical protein IMSAGC017_00754 [Thomasclavelia cocleata]|uniref:Uncharacterized protein n=1 Tax=Thomasclavelia cocleata TaxID=69824 RepID=A0A829Z9S1_9FIRM|nr:hypothetical protein IMSAGC017_00754 [Thomasclavelia cocleata]
MNNNNELKVKSRNQERLLDKHVVDFYISDFNSMTIVVKQEKSNIIKNVINHG